MTGALLPGTFSLAMNKRKLAPLMMLAAVFCASLFPSFPAAAAEIGENVKIAGSHRKITVIYKKGREAWARYVAQSAKRFLEAAGGYLDARPNIPGEIFLVGQEKVYLEGKWVGSYVRGNRVYLEYGLIRRGYPWMVFHGLGHLWFDYQGYPGNKDEVAWFIEGVVSYLAIAMNDIPAGEPGALMLEDQERGSILEGTLAGFLSPVADPPMHTDFRSDGGRELFLFWANKTFKLQYVLYRELGAKKYRKLLRAFYKKSRDSQGPPLLELMHRIKPINWKTFLNGWVFPGAYGPLAYRDFLDADGDGLIGVEEHYAKTDPAKADSDGDGIPDGAEVAFGLDPLKANPREVVKKLAPFVDGDPAEWAALKAGAVRDPRGDSSGGPSLDMVELSYLIKRKALYLMIRTAAPPSSPGHVVFSLIVDVNMDNRFDRTFTFSLKNPRTVWRNLPATKETAIFSDQRGGRGKVIEMVIPLERIGASRFQILPTLWDNRRKRAIDSWSKWIPIQVKEAPPTQ